MASGDSFTFVTDAGNLDVLGTPSGTNGYDDLMATASEIDLEELIVMVYDLEDLDPNETGRRPPERLD